MYILHTSMCVCNCKNIHTYVCLGNKQDAVRSSTHTSYICTTN